MSQPAKTGGQTLDQFRSYLYLLARAHLGPNTQPDIDASDLVQRTLMVVHENKSQFRGETDAQRAAWLRRILTNNLADELRHQHRAKRDVSRLKPSLYKNSPPPGASLFKRRQQHDCCEIDSVSV